MRTKVLVLATTAGATLAVGAAAAGAATGPPPPPKATGGQKVKLVASGLQTPTSFAVGAGKVFEGDGGAETSKVPNGGVFMLSHGKGVKLAGSPNFVSGLAWHKGALYVAGGTITKQGPKWQVQRWSGFNGTKFAKRKAIWTGPKGFDGTNGIAFSSDGRLFLGVDVGLTNGNDHGPAKTPFVYSILSMKVDGSGAKVFAKGMRQPWQMAFPKGSNSPLVSNLGQDGPKNIAAKAPDSILRVKQGDNYGFPKCNFTSKKACKGFAKPFQLFTPHTDIMGMVIIGKRLYMTSFVGTTGKGPGGEVLSMPLKGGKVKPLVTGFVAPTVGLGSNGKSLYIGELTGQVFKVTP
jgi:glucose/arabinose dehydrogenase